MIILRKLNRYIVEQHQLTSLQQCLTINTLYISKHISIHYREITICIHKIQTFNRISIYHHGKIHLINLRYSHHINNNWTILQIQTNKKNKITGVYQINGHINNISYQSKFNVYDFIMKHFTYYQNKPI